MFGLSEEEDYDEDEEEENKESRKQFNSALIRNISRIVCFFKFCFNLIL